MKRLVAIGIIALLVTISFGIGSLNGEKNESAKHTITPSIISNDYQLAGKHTITPSSYEFTGDYLV